MLSFLDLFLVVSHYMRNVFTCKLYCCEVIAVKKFAPIKFFHFFCKLSFSTETWNKTSKYSVNSVEGWRKIWNSFCWWAVNLKNVQNSSINQFFTFNWSDNSRKMWFRFHVFFLVKWPNGLLQLIIYCFCG